MASVTISFFALSVSVGTLWVLWYNLNHIKESLYLSKIDLLIKIEEKLANANSNLREETRKYRDLLKNSNSENDKSNQKAALAGAYLLYLNCLDRLCFFTLKSGNVFICDMHSEYAEWIKEDLIEEKSRKLIDDNGYLNILKLANKLTVSPTDEAATKLIYLAVRNASKKWSMPIRN